jgi:hypothetical protein
LAEGREAGAEVVDRNADAEGVQVSQLDPPSVACGSLEDNRGLGHL